MMERVKDGFIVINLWGLFSFIFFSLVMSFFKVQMIVFLLIWSLRKDL